MIGDKFLKGQLSLEDSGSVIKREVLKPQLDPITYFAFENPTCLSSDEK